MKSGRLLLLFLATGLGLALIAGLLAALAPAAPAAAALAPPSSVETIGLQPASVGSIPEVWQIECVDCPHQIMESTDRILRLDGDGLPHLAYGSDHLYYTWYDGSHWQIEIADPAPYVGMYASLALDGAGNPSISYYDALNGWLKFARRTGGGWQIQIVDKRADNSTSSLGLDSTGKAYISYRDEISNTLKVASQSGSGWTFEYPDASQHVGLHSSLAIGAGDNIHIAYSNENNSSIRYAMRTSGGWMTETAASGGTYGEYLSVAVNHEGRAHISFFDGLLNSDLKYTQREIGGWQPVQTVDLHLNVGSFNSIAVDGSGQPHISYFNSSSNDLMYASLVSGAWVTSTIDTAGSVGLYTSLALNSSGQARIAYYDTTLGADAYKIKYAVQTGSGWQFTVVDTAGDAGADTSLALDRAGFAHISYRDNTWLDLKYASQTPDGWIIQTVDSAGDVGMDSSLALDSIGYPHIAYYDNNHKDLKYAYQDASGWHTAAVDQAGDVGASLSLALDGSDEVHISYYAGTTKDLRYAHLAASGWVTETVDSAGDVGQYNSLTLDAGGNPQISYFNNTMDDLVYATLEAGGWLTSTVDDNVVMAGGSSIALGPDGQPAIAYYASNSGDLRYAEWDASDWSIQTADNGGSASGNTGGSPSLELDQNGNPHIAYTGRLCPGPCGSLAYATREVSTWVTETVDASNFNTGRFASLELTGGGLPRISYYDALLGDLKLATTPVALSGLAISGPLTGSLGSPVTLSATAAPPTATLPITMQWEATGQAPLLLTGGITQEVTYTWTTTGVKMITVTATNPVNAALLTATHTITISVVPIQGLVAANDSPTLLGMPTTFTATLSAGSIPTFTWDFGDGATGTGAVVTHTYAAPGTYTATVTATNSLGQEQATTIVRVITGQEGRVVYLPIVMNGWP